MTLLCTTSWTIRALGGPGSSGKQLFNWHPLMMSLATLVLLPQGALLWSSVPPELHTDAPERVRFKRLHMFLMISGFLVVNSAIGIAYASHKQQGLPNFYSVHSWIGIAALVLMKSNVVGGLVSALFPNWQAAKLSRGVHRRVGIAGLALSFSAAVSGLAEQQGFLVKESKTAFNANAIMAGVLAMLFICVGALVVSALEERARDGGQGMKEGSGSEGTATKGKVIDDVDKAGFA